MFFSYNAICNVQLYSIFWTILELNVTLNYRGKNMEKNKEILMETKENIWTKIEETKIQLPHKFFDIDAT